MQKDVTPKIAHSVTAFRKLKYIKYVEKIITETMS